MEKIIQQLLDNRVTMVFTATVLKDMEALCYKYMKKPVHIEIEATEETTNMIEYRIIELETKRCNNVLELLPFRIR
ncbi:hypothetical protein ACFFHM_17765 [Halalkalibacter kiskunsagensis]|uniref:Helicase ATP-binding domain-containing protein n=1 Tax=Halalkalibacter kiskunsagensis TaxID=1548599 RepID=A0ABV6KH74_9BACI